MEGTIKKTKRIRQSGDFVIVFLTLVLVIFGIIMVFSSSYYFSINETGSPYGYLIKEIWLTLGGFVLMMITSVIDYHKYKKLALPFLAVSLVLLLLLFTPLGYESNGAVRWIPVGPFPLMPGEVAKIAVIIFIAWYLSAKPVRVLHPIKGLWPLHLLLLGYAYLIMRQPNLSTAITISLIIILMIFVAGLKWRYVPVYIGLGVAGVYGLLKLDPNGFWMKRFTSFLDPFADPLGAGYQGVQSLMALGSGGLFGLGLGKSIQKTLYLPEPQNDFILAVIGEELGLVGVFILLLVYIILIWRGIHIAVNAPDQFGLLLAAGITIMLTVQVLLNVAVVTSSMPATGISLPLVSYGGNALWLFMGAMGILLNISRHGLKVSQEQS